jgi:hypothetical protein
MIFANKKEKKKFAYRENELPKIYYNFTDVFAKNKTTKFAHLEFDFLAYIWEFSRSTSKMGWTVL